MPEKGRGEKGEFFIWGHWTAFYVLLPDIVLYEILGTAYGLTNTIHFLGSLIAPWATGWVRDGERIYEMQPLWWYDGLREDLL